MLPHDHPNTLAVRDRPETVYPSLNPVNDLIDKVELSCEAHSVDPSIYVARVPVECR